jgi:hypothetical protein
MLDSKNCSFVMLLGHFLENEHLKSLITPQSTAFRCENLIESFASSTSFDESLYILDSLKPYLLSGEKDLSDFYFSLTNAFFLREIRFNVSHTVKICEFLKDEFMAQYTYYALDSESKRILGSGLKKISDLIESISDISSTMPFSFQIAHLESVSENPKVLNNYVTRMLVKDLQRETNELLKLKVKFAATIKSIKNS